MERNGLGRAFEAVETGDTVLLAVSLGRFSRDRSHRTLLHTRLAAGANIRYKPPENSKSGTDREEGAERTEVTTPESLPDDSKDEDSDKKKKDEEIHLKERQWNRGQKDRIPGKKVLNRRQKMVVRIDRRGIKGDHHGSGDETDRVQKIHHLKGHQPCGEGENENSVTKLSQRPIVKRL